MIRSSLASQFVLSPNVEARRGNRVPDMLILHYTGMDDAKRACDWLCNPLSKVSCHYLIDEAGVITQMVDEVLRAWHAGISSWCDEDDINSCSIGIEIHNPGHSGGYPDFPKAQMQSVIALSKEIVARYGIAPRRVLAHSDIAPERKVDPGEKFDWALLHTQGVGHWVLPEPLGGGSFLQTGDRGQSVEALQGMLKLYGYGLSITGDFDAMTFAAVRAFQLHFRPAKVDGIADTSTVATLHRLLQA
jgi:N-acetylmuramoyl-L-alanine amidase